MTSAFSNPLFQHAIPDPKRHDIQLSNATAILTTDRSTIQSIQYDTVQYSTIQYEGSVGGLQQKHTLDTAYKLWVLQYKTCYSRIINLFNGVA